MESLPDDQGAQMLGANLIVANVRGRPVTMYIVGARVESMCHISILTAGLGINFTCISYDQYMDFGIVVELDLVPNHEDLATWIVKAMGQFHAISKPKPKRS